MKKVVSVTTGDMEIITKNSDRKNFAVVKPNFDGLGQNMILCNRPGHLDPDGTGFWVEPKNGNNRVLTSEEIPHVLIEVVIGDLVIYSEYDFKTGKMKIYVYEVVGFKDNIAVCKGLSADTILEF